MHESNKSKLVGGFMEINGFGLSRGTILVASLLALSLPWLSAVAQTPDAQAVSAETGQTPLVPARVTQTVDRRQSRDAARKRASHGAPGI